MAKSSATMTQVNGTSHLKIDKKVDSDQILVTLSLNGKEWLSPKGWVKKEKGTLLDCQSKKDHTIIEIPTEYAKTIKSGDKIELKSREIDLSAALTWGTAAGRNNAVKSKANGAAPLEALSLEESEKRAKEAEKAAAQYRTQMEEASKAREAAQAAALLAARKADEALKAEADRIAEMEKAAKAFEDAERKRMEEQRRLDRERRLEEERKAEAARLAEEARLRAEAERLQKERDDARKFFKSEISTTKAEKKRLQEVLSGFKAKAESAEAEIADSDNKLTRLEKLLAGAQRDEAENKASLKQEETRINELKSRSSKIQNSISDLEKSNEKLFRSLEKAETAHEKALKEVEAAKMRAAEALKALSSVKVQTDKVKSQRKAMLHDKKDAESKLSDREKQAADLKAAYDKSRIGAENELSGIRSIKKAKEDLSQKLTSAKTDIARTLQDIKAQDETLKRQQTSLKQIEDLENADDIRKITGKSSSATSAKRVENSKTKSSKVAAPPKSRDKANSRDVLKDVANENAGKGGFLSRFFSRSGQDVVPTGETKTETTINVAPPPMPKPVKAASTLASTPAAKIETPLRSAPVKNNGQGSPGVRLNSWLLLGIATAGIAALGTAYALNNNNGSKTSTASTTAQSPAKIDKAPADKTPILVAEATGRMTTQDVSVSTTPSSDQAGPDIVPQMSTFEETSTDKVSLVASTKPEPETTQPSVKDSVKTGTNTAEATKTNSAATTRQDQSRTVSRSTSEATRTVNYEAVTTQVQEQLSFMGFYNGPIDGQQTRQTQQAMSEFKSLYDLPVNNELSGEFINTLKRAHQEQVDLRAAISAPFTAQDIVVQFVENTVSLPALESQPVNPATSVDLQPVGSAQQQVLEAARQTGGFQSVTSDTELTIQAPETETLQAPETETFTQSAALTVSTPTEIIDSTVEDNVIPAKVVRKARAEYPLRLLRQEKLYNAKVYVAYDVDVDGRVVEPTVKSVDFDGTTSERKIFERAAIKAVKAQRFEPRTVNGEPAVESDRITRISFNAE